MSLFKNNHANQRYFERIHPDIASKRDIVKAIQDVKNIQYFKKLTESRTMAYVHLPNQQIVKVVINKKKKELVTILPWQDLYQVEEEVISEKLGMFHVIMYPDCYLESGNFTAFTKIKQIKENSKEESISFSSLIFETIFYKAWLQYKKLEETK